MKWTWDQIELINRAEPFVFAAMTLTGCWAFFSSWYFFSIDGAAHVYSATIINDLLFNAESIYSPYFSINSFPIPNWIGHVILCVFLPLAGPLLAEKILIGLIVIGTPVSFRLLLVKRGWNVLPAYMSILLVHTGLLYFGFYNFSLGIPILLLILWLTPTELENISIKRRLLLALMFLLLYFSHLFVLVLAFAFQVALIMESNESNLKNRAIQTIGAIRKLYLSWIPALILMLSYVFLNPTGIGSDPEAFSTSWEKLVDLSAFKLTFSVGPIGPFETYRSTLWYLILFLSLYPLFQLLRSPGEIRFNAWFTGGIAILAVFFIIPDSGLYISSRLIIMLFLVLLLWLSTFKQPLWIAIPAVILVFMVQRQMQFKSMAFHSQSQGKIEGLMALEKSIPEGALVGTFKKSDNWLEMGHSNNYVGAAGRVVQINNYEAVMHYFPIVYGGGQHFAREYQRDEREVQEALYTVNEQKKRVPLEYILLIKDQSSAQSHLRKADFLERRGYQLMKTNKIADLYRYN